MSVAFLGLGSNIEAEKNIPSAMACLRETFPGVEFSPVYRCAPHGFEGNDFINLVASVETEMTPLQLKGYLGELENRHHRNRQVPRFSDRTLDIDILLYADLYLLSPQLEIPREEILEAAYVLKPLADLAPDRVHPATKKTMLEHWQAFPRESTALKKIDLQEQGSAGKEGGAVSPQAKKR